jgi:ABC-type glutathione transport system ATPase component
MSGVAQEPGDPPAQPPRPEAALVVRALRVRFGATTAVDGVSLAVARGEILALVGPSGSGKSALVRAVLGLVDGRPGVVAGRVRHRLRDGGEVVLGPRRRAASRRLHRGAAGLVLQSGRAALEPGRRLGDLFREVARRRLPGLDAGARAARVEAALAAVALPTRVLEQPSGGLSGGMAQRAMLALADLGEPELLCLDEPTTGLDTALRARVVDLLAAAHARRGFTGLLVTHDPGIARALATRVAHVRAGRVQETAPAATLRPLPRLAASTDRRPGAGPVLELEGVGRRFGAVDALSDVSFEVRAGTIFALVGRSGSGKTTLGRIAVGLERPDAGTVRVAGRPLGGGRARPGEARILFQNPYASLNPQDTPLGAVAEGIRLHLGLRRRAAREAAARRLLELGLERRQLETRILGLSGGERRRVALARALVGAPRLLVLDEPATGLDPDRRASIARLLTEARDAVPERGMLLIAHDLGFVRAVADEVLVLERGRVAERLAPASLDALEGRAPETRRLLEAAARVRGEGGASVGRVFSPGASTDMMQGDPE